LFMVRLKKIKKILLLILFGLGLLSAIVAPFIAENGIAKTGPVIGGMAILYLLLLLGIKAEARKNRAFILQLLQAREK
jgi:hypothetical protein